MSKTAFLNLNVLIERMQCIFKGSLREIGVPKWCSWGTIATNGTILWAVKYIKWSQVLGIGWQQWIHTHDRCKYVSRNEESYSGNKLQHFSRCDKNVLCPSRKVTIVMNTFNPSNIRLTTKGFVGTLKSPRAWWTSVPQIRNNRLCPLGSLKTPQNLIKVKSAIIAAGSKLYVLFLRFINKINVTSTAWSHRKWSNNYWSISN